GRERVALCRQGSRTGGLTAFLTCPPCRERVALQSASMVRCAAILARSRRCRAAASGSAIDPAFR
ncbi:hypothetical protein, partial [Brucella cytisi]|uniref:hypothetical protein n=1 Tax=Brucella cytisi TaxID=407152 RepID=UPI00197CDA2C